MKVLGVDIGSTASKGVVMDEKENIISSIIIPYGTGTSGPQKLNQEIFDVTGMKISEFDKVVATGYGRMKYDGADKQISELSCHAKGVVHLIPSVRTIIDIGGQDAKALKIDKNGRLESFVMNDKCAAGTGRFLDVMSKILETDISNLGELDKKADNQIMISSTCTVFAESEVISNLSEGVSIENIIAGIHDSVAKRVASLAKRIGLREDIVLVGGVATNSGVVRAMNDALGYEVIVPDEAQFTGAIGAALSAVSMLDKK
ncbi:2-hydroxyglutaryl-CoA dehydratase [Peptostreptococcus russellii]|uniref:2-hydroxyglutaryl-CoA dehydratase n=1 Tax=Peptostreptococcus russellii TaxID=215200 RepID=A0A2P7PZD2_9FIRM|nr:acyl-CoA dehydratase activase [Peptostreptococcus russellii]PSJ31062.1 2-hydroxyglutaryl-CoA dehydratase [Peptostreptococcus russellii]